MDRLDLAHDPVISWAGTSPEVQAYWLGSEDPDQDVVRGRQVSDALTLIAHVRLGNGIAFMPRTYLEHSPPPSDVSMLQVEGLAPAQVYPTCSESENSPLLARFIRHALSSLRKR